MWAQLLETGV